MTLRIEGQHWQGSFGAVNNARDIKFRIKEGDGAYSEYTAAEVESTSGTSYKTKTYTIPVSDYHNIVTVQAYISDSVSTANGTEVTVKAIPVFEWGKDDFKVNVPLEVTGDIILNGHSLKTLLGI